MLDMRNKHEADRAVVIGLVKFKLLSLEPGWESS